MTPAAHDFFHLLAWGCLGLHAVLAVTLARLAYQQRERWALMFALAYMLTSLRLLLRLLTSSGLPSVQLLAASAAASVLLSLALTDGSLRFLKFESRPLHHATLLTVFVVSSATLLSAMDVGLRWAIGLWLVSALSLPLAAMFFYQATREPGIGHRFSGAWLLCFAGLVLGLTLSGLIDRPLLGIASALPLGMFGLNLLRTEQRRQRAARTAGANRTAPAPL